jgi:hypothetical protein
MQPRAGKKTYTVKAGDTSSRIALIRLEFLCVVETRTLR